MIELVAIVVYSAARPPSPVAAVATAVSPASGGNVEQLGNVERLGLLLYTDYLIPFELASILLLVAMVGAIVLAKREL